MELLRRLMSIIVVAVLGLTCLAPLLALGQAAYAGVPACCRRNGQHHCVLSMGQATRLAAAANNSAAWQAPFKSCPCFPAAVSAGHFHETLAAPPTQAFYAAIASYGICPAQTEARRRVSQDRARQKRGPPAALLPI